MGQVLQEMAFWTKRKMVFWNRKMAAKRKQASPVVASQKGYFVYFFWSCERYWPHECVINDGAASALLGGLGLVGLALGQSTRRYWVYSPPYPTVSPRMD